MRLQNSRTNLAASQVDHLVRLYTRCLVAPTTMSNLPPQSLIDEFLSNPPIDPQALNITSGHPAIGAENLRQAVEMSSIHATNFCLPGPSIVPSSPHDRDTDLDPNSNQVVASTTDDDSATHVDDQLEAYAKEPAVTWEDLKTRPRLYANENVGLWRFCSTTEIINGDY